MAFQDQQPGDIHATLAVSQEEARFGSSRVINLPDGRTTTVVVPAGTSDGHELRLAGQGSASRAGGLAGDLILRVSVVVSGGYSANDDYATERALYTTSSDSTQAGAGSNPGWSASSAQGPSFASAPTDVGRGASSLQARSGSSQPYPDYGGYQTPAAGQSTPPNPQPYSNYGGHQTPAAGQSTLSNPQSYGGYQASAGTQNYPQSPAQPSKPQRSSMVTALILVVVVVVIVASGLGFYFGYYQPGQAHAVATQTAQTQTAATANAAASGTAQIAQATVHAAATSTAQVQATTQAYQNIYTQATKKTPVLDDPLNAPALASLWDITLGSSANGACAFTGGAYHSTIPKAGFFEPCYALSSNYHNFAFQVDMTITQGDSGGILLRANTAHSAFYLFRISVDGSFSLYSYTGSQGAQATLLLTGSNQAIKGLNQNNEIAVVAQQTTMYFYVNHQYLGSSNDNTYSSGQIGVFAESQQKPTDAAFSHAKVWTL